MSSQKGHNGTTETFYVMPPSSSSVQFCIFCFKNESKENIPSQNEARWETLQRRFFIMVQEHFEERMASSSVNTDETAGPTSSIFPFSRVAAGLKIVCCLECFPIIDSYCTAYDKIKCLRMELDRELRRLEDAIKYSDEDISKLCAFQDWCALEERGVEESMEFRRQFHNQCKLSNLKCFPQVPLRRIHHTRQASKSMIFSDRLKDTALKRKHSPVIKTEPLSKRLNVSLTDEPSATGDNGQDDQPPVVKEEVVSQAFDDDYDPVADLFENVYDSDEISDNLKKTSQKGKLKLKLKNRKARKKAKKRVKTSKKKSIDTVTKPKRKNPEATISCQKCQTEPRPMFASLNALQAHQNYLHTNGYAMVTKTESTSVLRLEEKDLKFHGYSANLTCCSDYVPECPQKFWSVSELNHHLKYHEDITCETCNVVINHAIDMALHQLSHFEEADQTESKSVLKKCGKCEYTTLVDEELVNHYLVSHMNMPPFQATCPICRQKFKFVEKVPLLHYINYHDLTRLDDASSTGIHCGQEGCSAYFLTEDQLQQHVETIHEELSDYTTKLLQTLKIKKQKVLMRTKQKALRHSTREFSFFCEFCTKSFRSECEMRKHTWRYHTEEKWGKACGNIQLNEAGLTIDQFVTGNECVCKICENVFTSLEQLGRHELHHGEFKCNFCGVVKTLATELAIHETVHNIGNMDEGSLDSDTFKCPRDCSFTTKKRLDYIDHHLEIHLGLASDRKRCPICTKPLPNLLTQETKLGARGQRNWLVGHFMEFHDKTGLDPDTIPKCTICQGHFRTLVQLDTHRYEVHGKPRFECVDCGNTFAKRDRLRRHRVNVHNVDPSTFQFECNFPECGCRFETQVELEYHDIWAHNEKGVGILTCKICKRSFTGRSQMTAHMSTHAPKSDKKKKKRKRRKLDMLESLEFQDEDEELNVKPDFQLCPICGKVCLGTTRLERHIKSIHEQAEVKIETGHGKKKGVKSVHQCTKCSKICLTGSALTSHLKTHDKIIPSSYVCEQCGKVFKNKANLHQHRWRHKWSGNWNFQCSVCSLTCPTNHKLSIHMRKHTGEKPYICQICGAMFGFPQNLAAHTRKHAQECKQ